MYTFKENSWLCNGVKDLWYLTYIKKGDLFPNTNLASKFSGVWACKKGYSWKFAAYFGENLKETIVKLKAEMVTETQVRWPMEW